MIRDADALARRIARGDRSLETALAYARAIELVAAEAMSQDGWRRLATFHDHGGLLRWIVANGRSVPGGWTFGLGEPDDEVLRPLEREAAEAMPFEDSTDVEVRVENPPRLDIGGLTGDMYAYAAWVRPGPWARMVTDELRIGSGDALVVDGLVTMRCLADGVVVSMPVLVRRREASGRLRPVAAGTFYDELPGNQGWEFEWDRDRTSLPDGDLHEAVETVVNGDWHLSVHEAASELQGLGG